MELVTRNYWWPGVIKDVGKYVEECDMCQRIKNRTEMPVGKLKLSKVLEKPQTHLTVNFIIKLLVVAGKDAILVVCDRLSKIMHFVTTTKRTSAEGLARLFRNNVQKLHSFPESIVSDRGPQFATKMMKELNRMLEIETRLSTSYHLQTDGQIERMNQELEQYLRFFIDYRQKNWLEWLVLAKFVVNNKAHLATKISLFMVNYRREMRMEVDQRRRKNGESNRVCRKDKEGTRRGRSSINKSRVGDEEASRQRKEGR